MNAIPRRLNRRWLAIAVVPILVVGTLAALFYFGILHFNNPATEDFPVRGVDVSAYQGEIDWPVLSQQGITFAYLKATEGSTWQDKRFAYNFTEANSTDLYVGAYHFFSFESAASSQFDNIIRTVPLDKDMLPIAVDVEFYGGNDKNPPDKQAVTSELHILLEKLTEHYGQRPIIYTTPESYNLYIANDFADYPIWYRDILRYSRPSDGRQFTIWQYSNRHRMAGFSGEEKYIDMNVFNGSLAEFTVFATATAPAS